MFEHAASIQKFLKVGVWSDMKSGKTEFLLSFPNVALIDSEHGSDLFADRKKFDVEHVTRWNALAEPLNWLRANPGKFQTLGIDSITPLYQDLIYGVSQAERARYGQDIISSAAWGNIKRRFKALLRVLVEMPMHVVISARAKDDYQDIINPRTGQEQSKKTGDFVADIDRNLFYEMDFIVRCDCSTSAVKSVKKGMTEAPAKFTVTILGGRRKELPRGRIFDVTEKSAFDVIFSDLAKKLSVGKVSVPTTTDISELTEEPKKTTTARPVRSKPSPEEPVSSATHEENVAEIENFFGHRKMGKPCSSEDLKILFTRAGEARWPNGEKFTSEQAKSLLKFAFNVESSKELDKAAVDFLYDELGKVLAGRARLELIPGSTTVIIAQVEQPDGAEIEVS